MCDEHFFPENTNNEVTDSDLDDDEEEEDLSGENKRNLFISLFGDDDDDNDVITSGKVEKEQVVTVGKQKLDRSRIEEKIRLRHTLSHDEMKEVLIFGDDDDDDDDDDDNDDFDDE